MNEDVKIELLAGELLRLDQRTADIRNWTALRLATVGSHTCSLAEAIAWAESIDRGLAAAGLPAEPVSD